MKDAYQVMADRHQEAMQRLLADWKTSEEKIDQRIAELEAETAQCKEAFAMLSAGKPMGPIVEGHLIANMQRHISELEAEYRDCLQAITDMQSKWEKVQVENDTLRDYVAILTHKMDEDS